MSVRREDAARAAKCHFGSGRSATAEALNHIRLALVLNTSPAIVLSKVPIPPRFGQVVKLDHALAGLFLRSRIAGIGACA